MFKIHKTILVDENEKPIAVQIPFEEFQRIEEVIENFGLAKLMTETENDERLSGEAAKAFYESLKAGDVAD
ncbi:MAG: hypothetical protein ACU843_17265 [Gammaproteobacteria bacterium]